jgi:hypothetical protein
LLEAHDWELELFSSFFNQMYFIKLEQDGAEKLCWKPYKKGLFDVKSFCNVLIPNDSNPFHWRCIWRSKALLRVALFAWSVALGKILTVDNLRKWNIVVVDWC